MNFKNKVSDSFAQQAFMDYIGARITHLENGICNIELPYREELTQQNKYYHAGVIGTLADTAAGYAAYTMFNDDESVLSVEYKLNLLAPAKGQLLTAYAKVLKHGRTLTVCNVEVIVQDGPLKKLCATATVTLIALKDYKKEEGNSGR